MQLIGIESKTAWDSGFHAMNSGFQVPDSGFLVSGTWIPNSSRLWDYGFLEMYILYSKA